MGVPEGWKTTSIKDISSAPVSYGVVQTGEPVEDGVPCVRVVDISKGKLIPSNMITTSHEISNSYKRTILTPSDIIIALRGIIGRSALVGSELAGCNLTRGIARISPKSELFDSNFILQTLNASTFQNSINRQANGSALQEISIATLRKASILHPPLPEQRKIAEILSVWDRAIEVSEALLATATAQKRSLMQSLLTGHRRFPEFEGQAWKEVRLGDVCSTWSGGTPSRNKPEFYRGNIPWIKSGEVNAARITATKEFITETALKESSAKMVEPETVLVAMYGATAGVVSVSGIHAAINQAILAISPNEGILHSYLLYAVQSKMEQTKRITQGGQPNLNAQILRAVKIATPCLKEQQKISDIIKSSQNEIDAYIKNSQHLRTEKKALMQQLLTGKRRVVV